MADSEGGGGTDPEDKTEAPSQRRLDKSREEGQVALSREAVQLASLGAATLAAVLLAPGAAREIATAATALLGSAAHEPAAGEATGQLLQAALPLGFGVVAAAGIAALAATLLQTRLLVSAKRLRPQFDRVNPLAGAKRLFGRHSLEELARTLLKLGACVAAVWWGVLDEAREVMPRAAALPPAELAEALAGLLRGLLFSVLGGFAAVASLDLLWVHLEHHRKLRMSREEIKQETKESEGDPHIRAKRRQTMRRRSRRRVLAEVPKATVVVTNPTHFAVALAYERGTDAAPRVVAKGADVMARRIRETAETHGVPIVSNPPLARALFLVEEEAQVPAEHFAAVAEVIAFVWRLKAPRGV